LKDKILSDEIPITIIEDIKKNLRDIVYEQKLLEEEIYQQITKHKDTYSKIINQSENVKHFREKVKDLQN